MTITYLGKMKGSRRAKITDGNLLKREFIDTHFLTSDTGNDDEGHVFAAMATAGYDLGDSWSGEGGSTNTGVQVVSVTIADNDVTKKKWEVEVEYSSELPDFGSNTTNGSEDPTDWSPSIEWSTETIERVATVDAITGEPVLLPNGEVPFRPPVVQMTPITTLRYSRYLDNYTSAINLTYAATINSDWFLGYPPYTALMTGVSAVSEFIFGFQFWRVTYVIKFDLTLVNRADPSTTQAYHGWRGRTARVGTYYFAGGAPFGTKKTAMLDDVHPFVPLKADGDKATAGATPETEYFDLYLAIPFTPII